jgi:streptogramin lyase
MIRLIALAATVSFAASAAADSRVSYYPVPSGARPHDVAAAPDGTVWYTRDRATVVSASSIPRPERPRKFRSGAARPRTA